MYWKNKAKIQNLIAMLPSRISYEAYYFLQRKYGNLKKIKVERKFLAAVNTVSRIKSQGDDVKGKVFLEVGTGRMPLVPIAFYLMGAKEVVTIDLNPYLKPELVEEAMQYLLIERVAIKKSFGDLLIEDRFNKLISLLENNICSKEVIDLCNITYIAPGDAADSKLSDNSIDYHTSYTVYEHIPRDVITNIMLEAKRITKPSGYFVHRIDYSDHFSHRDKSISAINFLKYSDNDWDKLAGNRYMYMNRLRDDDFISIFNQLGLIILDKQSDEMAELKELLDSGFKVNKRFSDKSKESLSITGSWFIMNAQKNI